MLNKRTTIVVGAGASGEAKLPIGNELKSTISNLLNFKFDMFGSRERSGDNLVFGALQEIVVRDNLQATGIQPFIDASLRIRDALPLAISIDNFIDSHQGDREIERCWKLSIVRAILDAERNSLLYFDTNKGAQKPKYDALNNTWFSMFWKLITESCTVSQLEERFSLIELIVFNYDRCIEHFIYHSLQTYYKVEKSRAAELVRALKIYHPNGAVGGLPWYGGTHTIDFGGQVSSTQLILLADQIKTFTEGTDPNSSDIVAIRNGLANSQIVIFLGFAYHRQNLDLIRPTDTIQNTPAVKYFGTAIGISNSDKQAISLELANLMAFKSSLGFEIRNDLNCAQLFKEYWRSLSLS